MGPEGHAFIQGGRVAEPHTGRVPPLHQVTAEDGDVVVACEVAGLWRSGPGLTAPTLHTWPEYRVVVHGKIDADAQVFGTYDPAMAGGDALAASHHVRLFYAEGGTLTLLKDYRCASRN
jgi:hypothetical protein